jgi:hypothetical protein
MDGKREKLKEEIANRDKIKINARMCPTNFITRVIKSEPKRKPT